MKKTLLAAAFLAFSAPAFSQLETLAWSDEFDGTGQPDTTNWTLELGASGWGNQEIQQYTNLPQNAWQADGRLHIRAKNEGGGAWTSARLMSMGKREFRFGRVVFRAKVPGGSGVWPALWLLGGNILEVGWPKCGEIDVMEHSGPKPNWVSFALHSQSSFGNTVNKMEAALATHATEFHEYEARWTAEKIEWLIDGHVFYRYEPEPKTAENWPFDQPFFLLMNVAMGGTLGSDPRFESKGLRNGIDPALQSATMEVDWVRVFQVAEGQKSDWPEGLRLSPNPSGGLFRAVVPEGETAVFQLSDATGKIVFEQELAAGATELDFSKQPKGGYFAHFLMEKGRFLGKILLP